jgi:hypothetical protein
MLAVFAAKAYPMVRVDTCPTKARIVREASLRLGITYKPGHERQRDDGQRCPVGKDVAV